MKLRKRPVINIVKRQVIGDDLKDFDHNAVLYVFTVDGHEVRGVHWSGRFDGEIRNLAKHLIYMVKKYNLDFITTTESQQKNVLIYLRAAFLNKGLRWGFQKAGEYACLFDKDVFKDMPKVPPRVVRMTRTRGVKDWQQMWVAYFNLRHIASGRRFQIADVHGPSAIQEGARFRGGAQTSTAKNGWKKLGNSLQRFRIHHWWVVQIVVGDSNGDHRVKFWLEFFEKQLKAVSIWCGHLPNLGTHAGNRVIDGVWFPQVKEHG